MRRLLTFIAIVCAAALFAPAAHGSSRQLTVMQDDALVYRNGPEVRTRTLDEFKALGADVVKIQVYWNEIAPRGRRKPAGFDGTSPAAYDFSLYDATVREIVARGMRPLLSLGNRAPDWATARVTRQRGVYKPSAREFGRFVRAVGTRYSGSYQGLPRVTLWSIWNEPNLNSWLAPQSHAPSIYRALYLAGHKALRATGHGRDRILWGELAPRGGQRRKKTTPLDFLRKSACLKRSYRGCKRVKRLPTSGIAIHPYTFANGPRAKPTLAGDMHVGTMRRLTKLMDALARRGRLPRRSAVWITEFGFQTNPPDKSGFGSKLSRTPGFMDMSEWLSFKNPRVRAYAQYTLEDEPPRSRGDWSSWQSGLRFANGRKKRGVYDAFRMPVYVRTPDITRVTVFGGLRTVSGGSAKIESKTKGSRYRELGSASLNRAGYFSKTFRIKNSHKRTYRITIDGRSRVKRPVSR